MSGKKGRRPVLANLIPGGGVDTDSGDARVRQVPIEEVRPNRHQPRKSFDPAKLQDLVASIRSNGIIQPVIAQAVDGGYELISGERRYRAACMAGLKTVPTILRTIEREADALELTLIENLQREDLNAIEEAESYQKLLDEFQYTQEVLSRKLGRARVTVTNSLRLLKLPEEVQDAIARGAISAGHGKAMLAVSDADLAREVLRRIVEDGLSVRQTEAWSRRLQQQAERGEVPQDKAPTGPPPELVRLSDRLGSYLGTRVEVRGRKGGGGRIVLEYSDGEDLNRLVEKIETEF
jgi:ParB family transcriptional regulator, chromosome partitioning protein